MALLAFPLLGWSQQLPWPAESPFADSYGYRWQTNSAPNGPNFAWVDLDTLGQVLPNPGDEGSLGPIELGFDFAYYWTMYDQCWVGANGYLSFSSPLSVSSDVNGFPLFPTLDAINDVVAPYLADLTFEGPGNPAQLKVWQDTAWPRCVISWEQVPYFWSESPGYRGSNSFQVILDGQDSTIRFQYRQMEGDWDPAYDQVSYPFTVGIENLAGNMGLMPTGLPITDSLRPVDSTAIAFVPPATPQLTISDLCLQWIGNPENGGTFVPWSPPQSNEWRPGYLMRAQVLNSGQVSLPAPIRLERSIRSKGGNSLLQRQWELPSLAPGSDRFLIDYQRFEPPDTGTYVYGAKILPPNTYQDLNPTNDTVAIELVVVDTTQESVILSFEDITAQTPLFLHEGAVIAQEFVPFGYPLQVEALSCYTFRIGGNSPTEGFRVKLYRNDARGTPAELLWEKEVPIGEVKLPFGWTELTLPQPIQVDSGSLFVVWEEMDPAIRLLSEHEPPFSKRSFEWAQNQWVPSRYQSQEELLIRLSVRTEGAQVPLNLAAPFSHIHVYPNPAINKLYLDSPTQAGQARLWDLQGRMVQEYEFERGMNVWLLENLPKASYVLELRTPGALPHREMIQIH
ncbi:MAG: hypothetical protein AAF399_11075 [Bacteroidota bacterium]